MQILMQGYVMDNKKDGENKPMRSIKEIFRVGNGPSSSHTMGPKKAAELFLDKYKNADRFEVTLYGSLAATGKGHFTDAAILSVLGSARTKIIWEPKVFLPFHPNGMKYVAFSSEGKELGNWTVYSVGGGALADENGSIGEDEGEIYGMSLMTDILDWCDSTGKTYWEYVKECEALDVWDYLYYVWDCMKEEIERGLDEEGVLPGPTNLRRRASTFFIKAGGSSEENASGGKIVTAPTCGSCGVLPSVLYHFQKSRNFSDAKIIRALATAGLFGNSVKTNASISGAEVGCQGEVGVACAMAAAATSQLFGGSPSQIEYAAEMGLEHHLGMTCDPVCGMVQIPCIERNAYAAARALDANLFSSLTDGMHRVAFDKVVSVMKHTGHDLPSVYKETSEGGLAKYYVQMKRK